MKANGTGVWTGKERSGEVQWQRFLTPKEEASKRVMEDTEKLRLEESLVASIQRPDLGEALANLTEIGLDQLLEEGPLRDIPVLGTLLRLRHTWGGVRDYIFARKVTRFLISVGEIPLDERERFIAKIKQQEKQRQLGDTLLLLLDRLDDLEKPEVLARLFAAYMRGRYDLPTFRRLATALERILLVSLPALRSFYSPDRQGIQTGGEDMEQFAFAGLVSINFYMTDPGITGGGFGPNDLGRLFLEVVDGV